MTTSKSRYTQCVFYPKNPHKYVGTHPIVARSSWEFAVMRMADRHPAIIHWASESIKIPYYNPVKRKNTVYVPDFLFVYKDRRGQHRSELIEVKPSSQSSLKEAKTQYDKMSLIVNTAKWKAAQAFCKKNGMSFRVITEREIFANHQPKNRKK